ncbi:MAG TPA: hypothetical protein VFM58_07535 [Solirubrobacteraceae bacterium]|jgi:hypothetical protein|nr:hypothetical protein [Solirubrobacteraceae bacterium]
MDLDPHPLIPDVVEGLRERDVPLTAFDDLKELAAPDALTPEDSTRQDGGDEAGAEDRGEQVKRKRRQRALRLAATAFVPELATFVGYVGATLRQQPGSETYWTVLYLDPQLSCWLLVPTNGIVARDRITDEQAPNKQRDVIWVRADASIGVGSGTLSVQAQFLTGEFTRAGDVDAGPGGGTLAGATGVFCEGRSPGCCKPKTPKT